MELEKLGFVLILAGFALAFATVLVAVFSVARSGATSVGGCVLIFFVPICFGVGPLAPYFLLAALALTLALVALSFLLLQWALGGVRRMAQEPESSSR